MSADFARYLKGLIASWEGLAFPRDDAAVFHGTDYVAARFPEPYLNNAVLLAAGAVEPAATVYAPGEPYALWCLDDDRPTAKALIARGYLPSETTRPMIRSLDELPEPSETPVAEADPRRFAELIGVPPHLLRNVPGLWAYADARYDSGLALQHADDDVYVSMVFTKPQARGRGLATAVMTAALREARERGARTATLQSTPMAEGLYLRHGFRPVGRWQEWVLQEAR
jgi:GNAT superfamily N-acetyltransferase